MRIGNPIAGLRRIVRRLRHDESGMGAVEFALLLPILLVVYLMAFELTLAFSVMKRATAASSSVADLVTQQSEVSKSFLASMNDVAASVFVPFSVSGLDLKITGIQVDASKNAKVAWYWDNKNTKALTPGSSVSLADSMLEANIFLVHTELSVPHELLMYLPNFRGSEIKDVTISREYYYRQRVGTEGIPCKDC